MKLNELKVELVKQILESEDEVELRVVESVLNPRPYTLTAAQKRALDQTWARYKSGESKTRPWEEVVARVRGRRKK